MSGRLIRFPVERVWRWGGAATPVFGSLALAPTETDGGGGPGPITPVQKPAKVVCFPKSGGGNPGPFYPVNMPAEAVPFRQPVDPIRPSADRPRYNGVGRQLKTIAEVYRYDGIYRVLSARVVSAANLAAEIANQGSQPSTRDEAYTYDRAHNRTGGSLDGVTLPFVPNAVNEYTTSPRGLEVHDKAGNLVADATNVYRYDFRNRLVEVVRKSDSATVGSYRYDVFNRRTEKTFLDPATSATKTIRFVWDGDRLVEERNATGQVVAEYVHGPMGLDDGLFMARDVDGDGQRERYWYHANAIGSVVALTDDAGEVVERYRYGPWGDVTVLEPDGVTVRPASVFGNPHLFQGLYRDAEAGLYYARNRYYDPVTSRALTRDPIGLAGGINLYNLGGPGADLVNFTDPMGLSAFMAAQMATQAMGTTGEPAKKGQTSGAGGQPVGGGQPTAGVSPTGTGNPEEAEGPPRTEEEITRRLLETDPELIQGRREIGSAEAAMRRAATGSEHERAEARARGAEGRIQRRMADLMSGEMVTVDGQSVPNPRGMVPLGQPPLDPIDIVAGMAAAPVRAGIAGVARAVARSEAEEAIATGAGRLAPEAGEVLLKTRQPVFEGMGHLRPDDVVRLPNGRFARVRDLEFGTMALNDFSRRVVGPLTGPKGRTIDTMLGLE